jgi:hypothetical protein
MAEHLANANPTALFQPPGCDLDELIRRIKEALQPSTKREILPNAVYSRDELANITGFSLSTIIRAEESDTLIVRYKGRRRYIVGADALQWLAGRTGEGGDEQCA